MNSNQRSQGNNQSSNGGNEKSQSSSRGTTADKDNLNQQSQQSQQDSGSQQQGQPGQRQSNDVAGGLPKSPRGANQLAADQDMDDDTGLSNRGNRQSAEEIDDRGRQSKQSNVGRRDDGTPD